MFHTPAHKQFLQDAAAIPAVLDPIVQEVTQEWNRLISKTSKPLRAADEEAQDCREED